MHVDSDLCTQNARVVNPDDLNACVGKPLNTVVRVRLCTHGNREER